MSEVYFYHLFKQNTFEVLYKLLVKVYDTKKKSVVVVGKKDLIYDLDSFLWTFNPSFFLPHNRFDDNNVDISPIIITDQYKNVNKASVAFVIEKGELEISQIKLHERVCFLFDNEDVDRLTSINKLKEDLRLKHINFKHWAENPKGWTEKECTNFVTSTNKNI